MWGAVHVVFPSWVFECTKQRQAVSTKEHLVSAEFVLRGRTVSGTLLFIILCSSCTGSIC